MRNEVRNEEWGTTKKFLSGVDQHGFCSDSNIWASFINWEWLISRYPRYSNIKNTLIICDATCRWNSKGTIGTTKIRASWPQYWVISQEINILHTLSFNAHVFLIHFNLIVIYNEKLYCNRFLGYWKYDVYFFGGIHKYFGHCSQVGRSQHPGSEEQNSKSSIGKAHCEQHDKGTSTKIGQWKNVLC